MAVVDEEAAARLWPGAQAVGQTLRIGDSTAARVATVIGVIPMIPDPRGEVADGVILTPAAGHYDPKGRLYVRTQGDAELLRGPIRDALRELEPRLPVAAMPTLGESLRENLRPVAQMALGVGVMGGVALLLAALGLWAVLSFVVAQRRYEIGVRIALGAGARAVTGLVVRQALRLTLLGIGIGLLLAGASAVGLRSLLFGLPPLDPAAFTASAAVLLGVALLACAGPARRAARVDPIVVLRAEEPGQAG